LRNQGVRGNQTSGLFSVALILVKKMCGFVGTLCGRSGGIDAAESVLRMARAIALRGVH